jgi:hypothetical protein
MDTGAFAGKRAGPVLRARLRDKALRGGLEQFHRERRQGHLASAARARELSVNEASDDLSFGLSEALWSCG